MKESRDLAIISADRWFSRYIRVRDSRDDYPVCYCSTCKKPHHPMNMDCGHYIKRDRFIVRWDEFNATGQCDYCNMRKKGEEAKHRIELVKRHGLEKVEELESIQYMTAKYLTHEIREIAKEYRLKVNELLKNKDWDKWW